MPAVQGAVPASGLANTNSTLRKEIRDDIAGELASIADVKRTADSIVVSDNFHLDSKALGNGWKVEVQYRRGTKQTVAVALVDNNALLLADLQTAITSSAGDGHTWLVT